MSNANRDYAIVYDVKNSSLVLSRPLVFYITDKNTSNIFVRLVTRINIGDGIDQYTDIENATSYVLTMRVIKPNNEVKSIEATQHELGSIFQFDLTEDFKDIPGKYICELIISTIVSERQELITSDPFNYEVKRSILSNVSEIIETEDITTEKLLNNIEASKIRLFNDLELAKTNLHNDLNATSSALNSQIQASDNKLNSRLDATEIELSSRLNATEAELNSRLDTTKSELGNNLELAKSELGNNLELAKSELGNNLELAKTELSSQIKEIKNLTYRLSCTEREVGEIDDSQRIKRILETYNNLLIDEDCTINSTIELADVDSIKISTINHATISHGNNTVFQFNRVKNITIEDCVFQGDYDGSNISTANFSIVIKGLLNSTINSVIIKNNEFNNQYKAISLYRVDSYIIENNIFNYVYGTGIFDTFAKSVKITNNKYIGRGNPNGTVLVNDPGGSLYLGSRSENVYFDGNYVYNSIGNGAKAEGCKKVVFTNNIIDTFGKDGLKVMHCSHYNDDTFTYNETENFTISNNIIINGKKWRSEGGGYININAGSNGTIIGNVIKGEGDEKYGIYASHWKQTGATDPSETRNIKICDNVILGTYPYSIFFTSSTIGYYDISCINNTTDKIIRFLNCKSNLEIGNNKVVCSDNYCLEAKNGNSLLCYGNTLIGATESIIYTENFDRIRLRNNELKTEPTNTNCFGFYYRNTGDISIENNRFENLYRNITCSNEATRKISISNNNFVNTLDTPIAFTNHDTTATRNTMISLKIKDNYFSGYYTGFSNGAGIVWLSLKNYDIKNIVFDGNVIEPYNNSLKTIYPANVIYATYGNDNSSIITNLIKGKSIINNELVTLTDLVTTNVL